MAFSEARSLNAWQWAGKTGWWLEVFFDKGHESSWLVNDWDKWWSCGIIWWANMTSQAINKKNRGMYLITLLIKSKTQQFLNKCKYTYLIKRRWFRTYDLWLTIYDLQFCVVICFDIAQADGLCGSSSTSLIISRPICLVLFLMISCIINAYDSYIKIIILK